MTDFVPSHGDFYNDRYVMELDGLDRMLSGCDETDLGILRGLLAGEICENVCADNFISPNTLKYRIKKMVAAACAADKNELTERIKKYRLKI